MEPPGAKRTRVNDWPFLFDITDIAKLVFAYVPKLHCRQLVREGSGILQYNICSWMPRQDIDLEIQIAILKADNALCTSFLTLSYEEMLDFPIPNILMNMMQRSKEHIPLTDFSIPKCNLLLLAPSWTQPELQKNIRKWFSDTTSDNVFLTFLLGLLTTTLEIGDLLVDFQMERWLVLRGFLPVGMLTMDRAHHSYLAAMSPDEFRHVPKSSYIERVDKVFGTCIKILNWNLADMLWNDALYVHLTICIERIDYSRLDNDGDDVFHAPANQRRWTFEFQFSKSFARLDSALCFISSSTTPSSLINIIRAWTGRFFAQLTTKEFNDLFDRTCVEGHLYIIKTMWHISPHDEILTRTLDRCRLCKNRTVLEFAWSIIETDIRNDALRWMRSAFNNNNDVLWQFLFDKGILVVELMFYTDHKNETWYHPANRLGYKPVAMLSTIWHVPRVHDMANLAGVMETASACENIPVLRFLNANHAQLSQLSLFKHWKWICSNECLNLLMQIENMTSDALLFPQYANASPNVRETLWTIAPLHDPIFFLQTSTVTFDCCIFLLEKHAIDARTLINILKNSKTNVKLLDEIRAYTYCEVDE